MVIDVLVAQGQRVDVLGQQLFDRVLDAVLAAMVLEAGRETGNELATGFHLAQEQAPGIGGDGASIESGLDAAPM